MNDDACVGCGRSEVTFRGTDPNSGRRLCSNCAAYSRQGTCVHCGRHRRIDGVDPDGEPWCPTCQTAARTARADAPTRERIISSVCDSDPPADRGVVVAVLDEIAHHTRTLRRIDRHLATNPEVFSAGPTHAHHAVGRLVDALIAADVALTVSYVDCETCGRNLRTMRHKGQMLCASCVNKTRATSCGRCNKVGLVATRDPGGKPVCAQCISTSQQANARDQLTERIVAIVGDIDGISRSAAIEAIDVTTSTNRQRTSLLGRLQREPPLEVSCRRRSNTIRFTDELRARGANIAVADRPKPRTGVGHRCPACGRPTTRANTTNCRVCVAENIAERTSDCSSCGRQTRDAIEGLCGGCNRWAQHVCATCDGPVDLVTVSNGALACHRCLLAGELDPLARADPDDWVIEICAALRVAQSVASTRHWLAHSPGGRLLARLAAGELDVSHQELDRHTSRSVERLRGLLIASGALEADERRVDRLTETVMAITDTIADPADRRVVQTFLRWRALPRIRRRAETGASTVHSAGNLQQQTTVICRFIDALNAQSRALGDCRQVDIDNWFAAPGATPTLVTSFLTWARKQRHLPADLDIPSGTRSRQPTTPADQQRRWDIARRLVTDDTISADDRVAAALVVLYAQPLTRIAALAIGDVTSHDNGEVTIAFGTHQIDLTEPFAELARQLPIRRQNGTADHLATRWLFPSTRPDRAAHPTTIANRLRRIGIDPRPNRLAAISQLASEIPPALLAESIGISARQASKWVGLAGGNWSTYTRN